MYIVISTVTFFRSEVDRKYLNNDKCVPIYDVRNIGCTYSKAVRVLLDGDASLICTKQPILVENNYMFLVDLNLLDDPDDIKSDDCGHWMHNGRKSIHVAVKFQNENVIDVQSIGKSTTPDENSRVYCLVRTYYIHDPHKDFKRILYHIFGEFKIASYFCSLDILYILVYIHTPSHPQEHAPNDPLQWYCENYCSI